LRNFRSRARPAIIATNFPGSQDAGVVGQSDPIALLRFDSLTSPTSLLNLRPAFGNLRIGSVLPSGVRPAEAFGGQRTMATASDKQWAFDLVKQFDERWGGGVWPHIDRSDLAISLRERLNNPDKLNQGGTNLCGVASFVREWLQDDPVGYVWFAICLFEKGVGTFAKKGQGGRTIRPSQELKHSVLAKINRHTSKTVAPADWIVMASLREDLNISLNYRADEGWLFWDDTRGLSSVGDVVKLFERAGYQEVRDYANWWSKRDAKHLEVAGKYVTAGYKVVLFIDYRLLEKAKQDTEAAVATANHIVGLTTPVTFDGKRNYLKFKVFSWGKVQDVPEKDEWMPVKTLERHYYGFVAAKF
jgi:hypothetical protein